MATGALGLDSEPARQSRLANVANWLGIAALISPLAAFAMSFAGREACGWSRRLFLVALSASLSAVLLGLLARFRISRNPHLLGVKKAVGGYWDGLGGLLLCVLLVLISPASGNDACGGVNQRIIANDASAVRSMQVINTSCVSYAMAYPHAGFPRSLGQLGLAPSGETGGPEHAGMIDNVLASGGKSGYVFTYSPGAPDAKGRIVTYRISGRSKVFGTTGSRNYSTDQDGVIRATKEDRAATAQDPRLQ